jgi:hypothetical protein
VAVHDGAVDEEVVVEEGCFAEERRSKTVDHHDTFKED